MEERKTFDYKAVINAGEVFAVKMKEALHHNDKWTPNMAKDVGYKMSDFKKIARKFYPDAEEVQFLHILGGYSPQDIRDGFGIITKE